MTMDFTGKKYQGFTLVETVVSMFIFVLVIATVSQVFTRAFSGYRYEKILQEDLETAQFSMNTLAKELRTASIVDSATSFVKFYDHSQGKCFRYQITGTNLEVANTTTTDLSACSGTSLSNYTTVVKDVVGGSFSVFVVTASAKTGPQRVGKVTISLQVGAGKAYRANIQTSISLRDYENAGI